MIGKTIKKEMQMERFREGTHSSTKMMNEATGTALTVFTKGASRLRTTGILEARAASNVPRNIARKNPPAMRLNEKPTAFQKEALPSMQQRVEILKVLYRDANIIIFDEPTAVLTPQEIDELMEIIRLLKREGKTIILITHKLKEIKAVADRCTVLRRGKVIGTVNVADVTEQQLAEMMVGRAVKFELDKSVCRPGKVMCPMIEVALDVAYDVS